MHFGSYPAKVKLRTFSRCTFAQFFPIFLNGVLIEFRNLTKEEMKVLNMFCIRLARFEKHFIENEFCYLKFAHRVV